jgi:hypothetical protein
VALTINRPLGLSELLAETVRLYGERFVSALGLGLPIAGAFIATLYAQPLVDVLVVSVAFTLSYAAAARFANGDGIGEAWAQTLVRLPTLLVLTLLVTLPFALALGQLLLTLVAVGWLGLVGFAIPITMLEKDPDATTWYVRVASPLYRAVSLARVEILHAIGIIAALVIAYVVLGIILSAALAGFAENEETVAIALAQVVLAPFFFLGLSVLYFEQKVRAISSPRERA